jgi:hypothetical protein
VALILERRSSENLVRNGLVSVFLRKLEYCEGIMFLTTNRVSRFDEAILTRIHLMLRYDDLNQAGRMTTWRHFLDPLAGFKWQNLARPQLLQANTHPRPFPWELGCPNFNCSAPLPLEFPPLYIDFPSVEVDHQWV